MNKESDTHRASLMLVLWLDLREAMRLADAAQDRQTRLLEAWSLAAPPGEEHRVGAAGLNRVSATQGETEKQH